MAESDDSQCSCFSRTVFDRCWEIIKSIDAGKRFTTMVTKANQLEPSYSAAIMKSRDVFTTIESARQALCEAKIPPNLININMQLLSALIVPFGSGSGHLVSSNSNGKKIIELLIKAAVYNAEICIVPEVIKCRQYFYGIHISTHTTRQVLRNKGKTLDAFVTLVTTKSPPQDIETTLSYLTTFSQFVPPVLVADADTTSEPLQIENKKKHLFDSLMEFRRGHTSISIMGLFFSGNIVTVGILKPGATTDENNQRESFCTTDLQEVRRLIIYIHDFLHGQTIDPETIGYFCKDKFSQQFISPAPPARKRTRKSNQLPAKKVFTEDAEVEEGSVTTLGSDNESLVEELV